MTSPTLGEPPGPPSISYDLVPYPRQAIASTHPRSLSAVAALAGFDAPPLDNCRVLELGCASGGNLVPLADDLRSARLVGVDSSAVQIASARSWADSLGLKNVEFRRQDLREFARQPAGAEPFDYIIAHGVYSWTNADARDALLEICGRRLSRGGIAVVSYNAYPGWRLHEAIRELMLLHVWGPGGEPRFPAPKSLDAVGRVVARARDAIGLLCALPTPTTPHGQLLKTAAERIRALPDANLIHDHLSPINHPVWFSRFIAHAAIKGLSYLADAQPGAHGLGPGAAPQTPDGRRLLEQLSGDPLRAEQLGDLVRDGAFRQSILCRADAPGRPRAASPAADLGALRPERVARLWIGSDATPAAPDIQFTAPAPETFVTRAGVSATVSDPLLKSALLCLGDEWPNRLIFDRLLEAAWTRMGLGGAAGSRAGADRLCNGLLHAYANGVVELAIHPAPCAARLGPRPVARRLARLQAESPDEFVTSLRHENLRLNATARALLRLLDGSRDENELAAEMEKVLVANARNIDSTISLTDAERKQLAQAVRQDLRRFLVESLIER